MSASARFCVDCGVPLRASAAYQAVTHGKIPRPGVPTDLMPAARHQQASTEQKESGVRPRKDFQETDTADPEQKAGNGS
jgi:hypothetical protein